jgi:hypothetical protein
LIFILFLCFIKSSVPYRRDIMRRELIKFHCENDNLFFSKKQGLVTESATRALSTTVEV